MENFEKYFVEQSLFDEDVDEYLVVDSDAEIQNPELQNFMRKKKHGILSEYDLNSQHVSRVMSRSQSNQHAGYQSVDLGTINKVLMAQR